MLLLAVVIATCGLLWFVRQAVVNEQHLTRQRLVTAYSGYLTQAQTAVSEFWAAKEALVRKSYNKEDPSPAQFERLVREQLAPSIVINDPLYPSIFTDTILAQGNFKAIEQAREHIERGQMQAALTLLEPFLANGAWNLTDRRGRLPALNTVHYLLESLQEPDARLLGWLRERLQDYQDTHMPASQRHFLMRQDPDWHYPTLKAETLASQALQEGIDLKASHGLQPIPGGNAWSYAVGPVHLVFDEASLRNAMVGATDSVKLPESCKLLLTQVNEPDHDSLLTSLSLGQELSQWRVQLVVGSQGVAAQTQRQVTIYTLVGLLVIGLLVLLTLLSARSVLAATRRAQLKEDLAATISHELKTPLASMRCLVEVLQEDPVLDETKTRDYLKLISQENQRLSRLVENFLTFARMERGRHTLQSTLVHPAELLEETAATARQQFAEERLNVEPTEDLPQVQVDRPAMITALLNLLDNACKYSTANSPVTLRSTKQGDEVCFEVQDCGPSLNAKQTRQAFQVFRRLDSSKPGCGLGLHIVRTIVQRSHGRVDVVSSKELGNSFRIFLPIAQPL